MNNNELKEIVKKAVKKDNVAMEQLYKSYYEDVCFVCKKYGLNDEDVKDIAQDTFIQGFEKLETLNKPETFPAWIQRIASNKCLNFLKHNKVIDVNSNFLNAVVLIIVHKKSNSLLYRKFCHHL